MEKVNRVDVFTFLKNTFFVFVGYAWIVKSLIRKSREHAWQNCQTVSIDSRIHKWTLSAFLFG